MAEKQTNKERLKDITDSIEAGIKELFESDKYRQYLSTMSRFHKYSVNNQMLIYLQRPNATHVAGYNKWRDQFGRNVMRGEKGIKIIAPTPYKKKIEQEKLDPDTKLPMMDADGKVIMEEKEIKIPLYKPVVVFDVSQTEGKPLPQLAASLNGSVPNYEVFFEALKRSSPVPVGMERMAANMDGYFAQESQRIAIREGMSEVQTVCAAVHEIAHAKLHNIQNGEEQLSRSTEEIQAESISFAVCAYYGIETGENSFGYLATWAKDKELTELKASLETINKTSSSLITDIDRHYAAICKERGIDLTAQPETEAPAPEAVQTEQKEQEPESPKKRYMAHANPRSNGIHDRYFIQAYDSTPGGLLPAEIMGINTPALCIELTNRLNNGTIAQETARNLLDIPTGQDAPERLLLADKDSYLHIQTCDGGYDYTILDKEAIRELDGGRLDEPDIPISVACLKICDLHDFDGKVLKSVSLDIFEEINEAIERRQERDVAAWERQNPPHPYAEPQPGHEAWSEAAAPDNAPDNPGTPSDDVTAYLPEQELGVPPAADPALDALPMPDPAISTESRNAYGYTDPDILPLTKERALELFERDVTVYMLYTDNTEGMAFDTEEISNFDGIFGVEASEWEMVKDRFSSAPDHEAAFLNNPADSFAIYQLNRGDDTAGLRFMNSDYLAQKGLSIERDNYTAVYTGELHYAGDTEDKLNGLYQTFNISRPEDFTGHSLSVSDIVALKQDGVVSCHYVDSWGFKEIPAFLKTENYLKNAEMAMEDDYGMIDGIVNNGPKQTAAEIEADAMSGKPVSLFAYAQALQREREAGTDKADQPQKKPSVLAKLRPTVSEPKKSAPKKSAGREL